jgi:hypothetical protein
MRPEFTPTEEYLILYYRTQVKSGLGRFDGSDLAFLLFACGLFGWGMYVDDVLWMTIGLGVLAYRHVQRVISARRFTDVLVSILNKFEAAVGEDAKDLETSDRRSADPVKSDISNTAQ